MPLDVGTLTAHKRRRPCLPKPFNVRELVSSILLDSAARWSEGETRDPVEWTLARTIDSDDTYIAVIEKALPRLSA